ncbi:MAG: 30S ribosomal protein S15 [Bdellovibrionales bacterium RBG_16_40_8]|nr:MAG: 30S ribosomal protein S15 [Bdellovibrionales bacterium RBG_16_40_8]
MALMKTQKEQIMRKFRRGELDTGSSEVQVAALSARISQLTEHFKVNDKDQHSRQGMFRMVSKRRRLLNYLRKTDANKYLKLIDELSLRK